MAKPFLIEPHFRLQEWVAEEKGYFHDVGLDYVFQELVRSSDGKHHDRGDKVGAFQSFERGREAAVSCACHWTVDIAASKGKGRSPRPIPPPRLSCACTRAPASLAQRRRYFNSGLGPPASISIRCL